MDLDHFVRHFNDSTDLDYLKLHFPRYITTRNLAMRRWTWERAHILDIGAHWLHQSVLYALEGHQVTAADFPAPLDWPEARRVALEQGIDRLVYHDLSSESVFDALPPDSVDVVLFCEILEHITFNPVGMWKAIHRVLRPGGRIILTTPNYYGLRAMRMHVKRFFSGAGGGISVRDILHVPTNGPHWKEYSRREIREYFRLLSRDFSLGTLAYCSYKSSLPRLNWKRRVLYDLSRVIPILSEGIYAEVDLTRKDAGISVQPGWG